MRIRVIRCPLCEGEIKHIEGSLIDECINCRVNFDMLEEKIAVIKEGEDAEYSVKILVRAKEYVGQ
jgi:hypothetical protein